MSDIRPRNLEIYYRGKSAMSYAATLLFFLCLFCCACNSANSSKSSNKDSSGLKIENLNNTLDSNGKQNIVAIQNQSDTSDHQSDNNYVNDSFVNWVLDNSLSYRIINKYSTNNNTFIKKLKRNELLFLHGSDSIIFLKGPTAIILRSATIFTNSIVIDTIVKIGVARNVISKKFMTSVPDTFRLSELEGNCQFTFIFKNDTLYQINYFMRYIDF